MKIKFGEWLNIELDEMIINASILIASLCVSISVVVIPMIHYDYLSKTNPNYKQDIVTIERNCN
jgi:hypothetical protein